MTNKTTKLQHTAELLTDKKVYKQHRARLHWPDDNQPG